MDENSRQHRGRSAAEGGKHREHSTEATGQLLARRLVESTGSHTRLEERLRAEENELRRCFDEGHLTAEIPEDLPDFIGSEHEVWSDGVEVLKATLPGAYGRRWGSRRFASPSEYLERIHLAQNAFGFPWIVNGLASEAGRIRIITT